MRIVQSPLAGSIILVSLATLFVTGCGSTTLDRSIGQVTSSAVRGRIRGGQQPVSGATVTVWEAGVAYGSGAIPLTATTTDVNGNFLISEDAYSCDYYNAPLYITSSGGSPGAGKLNPSLVLAAGLGACGSASNATVNIDEVTTAVTAYALSGFFTTELGGDYTTDQIGGAAEGFGTYNPGLIMADVYTIPNLVNLASGTVNPDTSVMHIEASKIYSIADTLASCVNSTGLTSPNDTTSSCGQLFFLTTPPYGGPSPSDTFQAAVQLALYPYQNVKALYDLASAAAPFPGLPVTPNDWTVGISYTTSDFGLGISRSDSMKTSSTIDIDAAGNIWFPSNTAASHGVGVFNPATISFAGPYATGVAGPQYVAIDNGGNIWATDLDSSSIVNTSVYSPSSTGNLLPIPDSLASGPLSIDQDGYSVLFAYNTVASGTESAVEAYGAVSNIYTYTQMPTALVTDLYDEAQGLLNGTIGLVPLGGNSCDIEFADIFLGVNNGGEDNGSDGPVSYSPCSATGGGAQTQYASDAVFSLTSQNQLAEFLGAENFTPVVPLSLPEGIATDGLGYEWIANSGNGSVSTLGYALDNGDATDFFVTSPIPYLHNATNGNTMTTPVGIAIDASGNVWVSNAGCVSTTASPCVPTSFTLTELIGAAAPTITPLSMQNVNTLGTEPMLKRAPLKRRHILKRVNR